MTKQLEVKENHGYIEAISLEKQNNSTLMTINLKEYSNPRELTYYTSKILYSLTSPTAVEFNFYDQLPPNY